MAKDKNKHNITFLTLCEIHLSLFLAISYLLLIVTALTVDETT